MNALDWFIAGAVILSVALATAQGFFHEVFSLAGVVLGYLLAAWMYPRVAELYLEYVKTVWVANAAGFLTIFFAVVLVAGYLGRLARTLFAEAGLRWFDRMLGAAFGLVRGSLIAIVVVMALASFAPQSPLLTGSRMAPYLLVGGQVASWFAPTSLRKSFHDGMLAIRNLQPGGGQHDGAEKK